MISSSNFSTKTIVILVTALIYFSGCTATNGPEKRVIKETAFLEEKRLIAVLPVYNLSGVPAPLDEIRQTLIYILTQQGLNAFDGKAFKEFIANHRIRYIGGITQSTAQAFREEVGVEAVLITALELYSQASPPKIALTSRLVSTGDHLPILWMDGIGLSGDDAPGILGLSLVTNAQTLLNKSLQILSTSLINYLSGQSDYINIHRKTPKFWPKVFYSSPVISPALNYRVAVVPFSDLSERTYAGDIMALHFVKHLRTYNNFDVIEPGEVRQTLLNFRVIMAGGISIANAEIIFNELNADLILHGMVLDYQDYQGMTGKPKVDFSAQLIENKSREIVWSSKSYNDGDDRVVFFNLGKVNTAYSLASAMVKQSVELIGK